MRKNFAATNQKKKQPKKLKLNFRKNFLETESSFVLLKIFQKFGKIE